MNTNVPAMALGAGAQTQKAPSSNGPLIDAVNTMAKLEPGIIGLEPNLVLTSAAISLKRIADGLQVLIGQGSLSYDMNRLREAVREVGTAVISVGTAVERVATNTMERPK